MSLFGPPNVQKLKAKGDIPGLIRALSYEKDAGVRRSAALVLGQMGEAKAIKPLTTLLQQDEDPVREAAAWALGNLANAQSLEALVAALNDATPGVRKQAATSLAQLGDPQAIQPIIAALQKRDEATRDDLLKALVQLSANLDETERVTRVVEPFAEFLVDDNPHMRTIATAALDQMGWKPDQSAIGAAYWLAKEQWDRAIEIGVPAAVPLVALLKDQDKQVRQTAVQSLLRIGPAAADILVAALKEESEEIRQGAYWVLIKLGPHVIETLIAALNDESEEIRLAIARALGQIGDPRAVVPLISLFQDLDWSVRRDAYKSITKIGKPAVKELLNALTHPSEEIKWGAARTLETLGWKPGKDTIGASYWIIKGEWHRCVEIGEPAIPPLIKTLGHWDNDVCKEATGTLINIGRPAVPALIEMLNQENPTVRIYAANALGVIGDERAEEPLRAMLSDPDKAVSQAASEAISAIQTGEVWRGTS